MNPLDTIERELIDIGYREDAIRHDYAFSDVWGEHGATCSVAFAAFTQTPPSYRSAALAVIEASHDAAADQIRARRALGAPIFLVIEPEQITAWQVHAHKQPRQIATVALDAIPEFFAAHRENWAPDRIHRAKSIGHVEPLAQLDFVDLGLIPAIAGEIHVKLDRLIREAVAGTREFNGDDAIRIFFRGVFRLLAAKILMDREHQRARSWNANDVRSVLDAMDQFYELGNVSQAWPSMAIEALAPVWTTFRAGFNVANISADDLAYVYESTLVTDKARAEFGTHSTPRHVADYVVGRLRLWEYGASPPRVVEPFAGAGVFLGSSLRFMRDALPAEWNDKLRHDVLVQCITGAEFDPFAAEVAKLSLILADYPNANGWQIEEADLFAPDALSSCLEGARIILCNPPFEAFTKAEVDIYPEAAAVNRSKAVFALEMALRAEPDMLGFVLPNTVLVDRRFKKQRIALERLYGEIELVALPDGIFNVSQANTALIIARKSDGATQRLRSAVVFDNEKKHFAATGAPSIMRTVEQVRQTDPSGDLWITPSHDLWRRLRNHPRLGSIVKASWGLRWKSGQRARTSAVPGPGREPGFQDSAGMHQYVLGEAKWMDVRPEFLLAGGSLAWDDPKILCNATRLSRGYWRLAAAVDRLGRRATQQFMGLWPHEGKDVDLDALAAVINGPIVNAFLTEHSFDKRFRIEKLHEAPIPKELPPQLGNLSRNYTAAAQEGADPEDLDQLLELIDRVVFDAYGLDEVDQAQLLAKMGSDRPTVGRASRRRLQSKAKNLDVGLFLDSAVERDRGRGLGAVISWSLGERELMSRVRSVPIEAWAGEVGSVATLAASLNISLSRLNDWITHNRVIVLSEKAHKNILPLEQFAGSRPLPGLAELLALIGDPNVAWAWLRTARPAIDEPAPLEWLKAGKLQRVLDLAARDFG